MIPQGGVFHRARVFLFGERTQRLTEHSSAAHWLSYLLVGVQSAAVVLALGHQQLQLLLSGDPGIALIAALALFLLVSTVVAADLCLLATLRRLPVLARNRATWALVEHLAYLAFVLAVEGSTLALVLAVLDTDPRALVSDAPIIPPGGVAFAAQIGARAVLTAWTSVQLWIVRGKLPPQMSTLLLEGRELLGGKASAAMAALHLDGASLAALFDAYAAMSRPRARMRRWWNGGLIVREAEALAEEDRQREAVVRALSAFDVSAATPPGHSERPPTGPGSPTVTTHPAPASAAEKAEKPALVALPAPRPAASRRPAAARRARAGVGSGPSGRTTGVRTGKPAAMRTPTRDIAAAEAAARAAWQPGMSVGELERAAGISRNAASRWRAVILAETGGGQTSATTEGAAQ